jgi:hypothetical protein
VHVDPTTAQISVDSDEIPHILAGVPLRLRSIRIMLDRPEFALNPTNCDHFGVDAEVIGGEGTTAGAGTPFQVGSCASLPYGPSLSLRLTGGVRRRGHPAIHAVFKARPGEANTKSVAVALPKGELLDNAHVGTVCTRPQFAANACPDASLLGDAEVTTPLLERPLKGHAYLRSSSHKLPDLVIDLNGQIHIVLVGRIDTVNGGALRTTFHALPDTPVSTLRLDLVGASKGLIINSHSLCGRRKSASVEMVGQNDAVIETTSKLKTRCGSKARHKRHTRRHLHRAWRAR